MKKIKRIATIAMTGLALASLASCKKNDEKETGKYNGELNVATEGALANFVSSSYEERAKILGLLEEYALKNNLTGLVLNENGGYVKYASRVNIPTISKTDINGNVQKIGETIQHEYVNGYGFGVLGDGTLTGSLSGDVTYPTYYHTYQSEDPATINYMNDKGSVVGDMIGYVSSSYFNTKLNSTKDGYEWYASTATDANVVDGNYRPLPLNADGSLIASPNSQTTTTKYRIYVKTGSSFKYATASKNSLVTSFNGREVALEDYVTPFKELFTKSNGLARGAENLTGAAAIKGMAAYSNASADGFNAEAWENVGIKTGTDATGSYLDFDMVTPCTPFYAMYYLSSTLYAPIPAQFLQQIGGIKNWGSFSTDKTLSPVDTTLSTSAYVVENWQNDKEIVFKKNTTINGEIIGGENRFQIPGIHFAILKSATSDPLAVWNEYSAGKLDACSIPKDKLATDLGTSGTQVTKGTSTTKLNLNTTTKEEWEYLFGVNGTITQTQMSDYWNIKPIMSNDNFLSGLSWAIDRKTYSQNRGVNASVEYFAGAYLIDPETGLSYNDSEPHNATMTKIYGADWKDTFGYDFDKAIEYFKAAATELLANGSYKSGDVIEIEMAWQTEASMKQNGPEIANYIETAFNDPDVSNGKLTLKINNTYVTTWTDIYYKKMMVGQFDIANGGINGNTLNPLNFFEVLKSDNSSGFTLNWGPNTNSTEELIEYNGKKYTFDALFQAADTGAVVSSDGSLAKTYNAILDSNDMNEDGSYTTKIKYAVSNIKNVVTTSIDKIVLCWYSGEEYDEIEVEYTEEDGIITIQISSEQAKAFEGDIGFDIYFNSQIFGTDLTNPLVSIYSEFFFD